jgi:NAD-dependent SIR2 family protein deacetylase
MSKHQAATDCPHCQDEKEFTPPPHLLERIGAGEVVLFAGAGISTENKNHCNSTFYEEILAELGLSDKLPFPELMSKYCALPDGRIKLIEKIKRRFEYFMSFGDFYYQMTRFHRAISPLYMIKDIVTTNWDDFFERKCMVDAFVHDSDLAFWDATPRRVMKIHGSVTNLGSIVATSEDYQASFKRLNDGPLGAHLKSLIARKTVLYTGYSLSDENYLRLLRNIANMMGDNVRQSYFIAPSIDPNMLANSPVPMIPIETGGAYFFERVRARLSESAGIIRDDAFQSCSDFLGHAIEEHNKTAGAYLRTSHPLLVFALSYQDGLIHALKRITKRRKSGEYHSPAGLHGRACKYEFRYNELLHRRDYWNAAYARGYQYGLMLLVAANDHDRCATPPLFEFPFDVRVSSLKSALRFSPKKLPKYVAAQVKRIHRRFPGLGENLIPDHTPYL